MEKANVQSGDPRLVEAVSAILQDEPARLRRLLEEGLSANARVPFPGRSLLHLAALENRAWAIADLFEAGAVSQAQDNGDADGFKHPELEWLSKYRLPATQEAKKDFFNTWEAFADGNPAFTASHPQEVSEGTVWSPLAVLLMGVTDRAIASQLPSGKDDWFRQNHVRDVFREMEKRPGQWSPEAAQAVFEGAAGSSHPSILAWLSDLGLELREVPHPEKVLTQVITWVAVYGNPGMALAEQPDRVQGWLDALARGHAKWQDSPTVLLENDYNALRASYESQRLNGLLPDSVVVAPKRFRM